MNLEKILYTICVAFFTIFILSAILVLTNTLNMWLVGIVSLLIFIISFVILKIMKKVSDKMAEQQKQLEEVLNKIKN